VKFAGEIKLVIKGLLSRKGRSFLTILGIVIGVAGVVKNTVVIDVAS
jgi:hypothetical protein